MKTTLRRSPTRSLAGGLFLAFAIAAVAQPVTVTYDDVAGFTEGLSRVTQGAEGGDVPCMMNLASLLAQQNRRDDAVAWLEKAHAAGHPQARAALDQLSRMPLASSSSPAQAAAPASIDPQEALKKAGEAKDLAEVARWLRVAAEGGDTGAMYRPGSMLYFGLGSLEKNQPDGLQWIRRAAAAGYAGAKGFLEKMGSK